ncbi:MAG: LPS export ABC transporter permease LptG [Alphaproteobacteria bacterium]|nr:LPS export ABC transporter permease LptG [Alphaproteobacteria bacterium]
MKAPFTLTLSRYLIRAYLINTLALLAALLGIIYLFDTVELIRRASKTEHMPVGLILQMSLFKLPEVGQLLFPFAILFGAMFTFWQFNRRSELVVLRASGFSVWQFLAPVMVIAILIGCLQIGVINPIGAVLVGRYQQLENRYLEHHENQIAIFQEGLWLRQDANGNLETGAPQSASGYVILHARRIHQPGWVLQEPSAFYFSHEDALLMRLDAAQARLEPGQWLFEDVKIHPQGGSAESRPDYSLPTRLTVSDIEESFSSPQSLSFWHLPGHISTMENTGFDASHLRVYYYTLLAQPLLFVALILLAATVSMRPPRLGGTMNLLAAGVFIGFFVFFMSSYLQALGASQQIPPVLAAWSPAMICLLLGLTSVMHLEDG